MGLDMFLTKKTYVKNHSFKPPGERHSVSVRRGDAIRRDIKPERVIYIIEEVAYWRKANQIHKWFTDNCANGVDDCSREFYVQQDQLQELIDTCERVLAASVLVPGKIKSGFTYENGVEKPIMTDGECIQDPAVAKELLPTQEGFFFGSTEYNEYYVEALRDTIKQLTPLVRLKNNGDIYFFYSSSW